MEYEKQTNKICFFNFGKDLGYFVILQYKLCDFIKIHDDYVNDPMKGDFQKTLLLSHIITHLAGQTYVWHGCKWNFAGPQIYLQPAKIKSQHFGVSLKFLVCN